MGEQKTIRGTITKLFHSSPKWSAGKLLPERTDVTRAGEVSVAGAFWAAEKDYVILEGSWVDHKKYGRQFSVSRQIRDIGEISAAGLATWLAMHGEAEGIGPVKADKIAKEFGENFTGILKDNPEQIAIFAQVKLESVQKLATAWFEREELNVIGTQLAVYELTAFQIRTLYEQYKSNTVKVLEEDPYVVVHETKGLGFKKMDEIARKLGVSETHPGRLSAAILYCLWKEADDGSTCMEHGNLIGTATEVLGYRGSDADPILDKSVGELIESEKLIEYAEHYALPSCWEHESSISEFLSSANEPNPFFEDDESLVPETISAGGLRLDDSQHRAVAMALRNRACLISGGAGMGKTTILEAIVSLYKRDGLRVRLCAPTGKASRRIEEVVGHEASTIHRMLGYGRNGVKGFPNETLEADVVICDEASMISSELAYYLFRAIGPETALIIVGDHHQLPPVGAGALLRDSIQHELLPMTILNKCHRQAGVLKTNCSAILQGEVHPTEMNDPSLPWVVMRKFDAPTEVTSYLETLFTRSLKEKLGVDPITDVQLLTPQHGGSLGTRALNIMLQRLHQKSLGVEVEPVEPDQRPSLYIGDKCIQTKNNYDLDIMNGHQGIVVSVDPLIVQFGLRRVIIPKGGKGEIELAYALTVHKVQGSQFPCVAFVCHKSHSFMLHRHLLYTACTRAMRNCIIVGDDTGISRAVRTVKANERRTLLPLLAQRDD